MRICTPHCGLAPESVSGGEVYERELLTRIGQMDVPQTIILARGKPHPAIPRATIRRFAMRKGLRWWVAPLVVPPALRAAWPFDLLRAHSLRFMGPACLLARRVFGWRVPIVAHHHHLDAAPGIERRVIESVDAVIVGSEFSREQLAQAGCRTDHVRVVPYGVDTEIFTPGPMPQWPRVVTVGGKARKRLDLVLQAWETVQHVNPFAELYVLGGPPIRQPGVRVLPYVKEADKPALLRSARVFVSASELEGFGLAVAEAMACGVPTIVPNGTATLRELVGDTGLRFTSAAGLADALLQLLRDPEWAHTLGLAGRARIEKQYTWARCVAETLDVYRELR